MTTITLNDLINEFDKSNWQESLVETFIAYQAKILDKNILTDFIEYILKEGDLNQNEESLLVDVIYDESEFEETIENTILELGFKIVSSIDEYEEKYLKEIFKKCLKNIDYTSEETIWVDVENIVSSLSYPVFLRNLITDLSNIHYYETDNEKGEMISKIDKFKQI